MTPAFKTQFAVVGDSASVYFECHYFDAASWHDMSHLNLNGSAKKVDGHWLLAQADVTTAGVPYPQIAADSAPEAPAPGRPTMTLMAHRPHVFVRAPSSYPTRSIF
jgi:hypothetical protein